MKRPQFKLRTLMIAIAIAALSAWGYRLKCRYTEFARKFRGHAWEAAAIHDEILALNGFTIWHRRPRQSLTAADKLNCENLERRLRFEERMCRKYRRAMFFPWLSVAPDPVPPPNPLKDANIWVE